MPERTASCASRHFRGQQADTKVRRACLTLPGGPYGQLRAKPYCGKPYGRLTADVADEWDAEADRFDEEPDHGLLQPRVRAAWQQLLEQQIPAGASVLDVGCGTGTLSVLLAEHGCRVTGVDLSPRMVERAHAKGLRHNVTVDFLLGDASDPPVPPGFDVVLARHVLWALPDPSAALDRWLALTTAAGRLVLIEGLWGLERDFPPRRLPTGCDPRCAA